MMNINEYHSTASGIQTWLGHLPLTMISAPGPTVTDGPGPVQAQRHRCTNSARVLGDANAPEMGTGEYWRYNATGIHVDAF